MDSKLFTLLVILAALHCIRCSVLPAKEPHNNQRISSAHRTNNNQLNQINVQTTSGLLLGPKEPTSVGNSSVYKFLSVPYAKAPIDSLRFKRPVELNEDQVIDATKFGKTCPQFRHLTQFISPLLNIDNEHQTSEDCLHLNIFVPSTVATIEQMNRLEPNKQVPVIVWIPGEGFDFADARQFDGTHLAYKTQSIVVTVQYRVGVLGFLHAPKLGIQGNMGIHDQIMALRWVKRNIAAFGGDSDRVTLMGRFSGSMSISAMITAPKQDLIKLNGESLFNRVAMLSGLAVSDWIIDSHQEERADQLEENSLERGLCNTTQIDQKTCLQDMPIDQLLPLADYGWRLVVDNELIGQLSPIEAVKKNQFAAHLDGVLIGETGMEGTLCLYRHMLDTRNNNYAQLIEEDRLTTNDLYDIIRDDSATYFKYNLTKSAPIQIALEALAEDSSRTGSELDLGSSTKLREKYLNACSSYMIKLHSNNFKKNIVARNHFTNNRMNSNRKPVEVFHYELRYKPTFSLAPEYIKTAAHGDDIPLIFGLVYNKHPRAINDEDLMMTRKMMAMLGNFVHGNNPLLHQHATIDSYKNNENETTSLDDIESGPSVPFEAPASSLTKRSWSNEGQIYAVELNESDLNELKARSHNQAQPTGANYSSDIEATNNNNNRETKLYLKGDKTSIRVIVVEGPFAVNAVPVEQQGDLRGPQTSEESQLQYDGQITKSQRLLEHHRQQMFEDNLWSQRRGSQLQQQSFHNQQQQQPQQTLFNESSFMTMLVFSVCIMIFTLISICLCLFLLIIRNTNAKGIQHSASPSSSSCNICDDSHGDKMDSVLDSNRKENRSFNNVFAKLKNHSRIHSSRLSQPQTCASASVKELSNNAIETLHQRPENSAANEELR